MNKNNPFPTVTEKQNLENEIANLKNQIQEKLSFINDDKIKKLLDKYIKKFFKLLDKKDYRLAIEKNKDNFYKIIEILEKYSTENFFGINNEPKQIFDDLKLIMEKKYELILNTKSVLNPNYSKEHQQKFDNFKKTTEKSILNNDKVDTNEYIGFNEDEKEEIYFYDSIINDINKYKQENRDINFIKEKLEKKYSNHYLFKENFQLENINSIDELFDRVYRLNINVYNKQQKLFNNEIIDGGYIHRDNKSLEEIENFKERVNNVKNKLDKLEKEINEFEKNLNYKEEKEIIPLNRLCYNLAMQHFEDLVTEKFEQIDKINGIKTEEVNQIKSEQKLIKPNRHMQKILEKQPTKTDNSITKLNFSKYIMGKPLEIDLDNIEEGLEIKDEFAKEEIITTEKQKSKKHNYGELDKLLDELETPKPINTKFKQKNDKSNQQQNTKLEHSWIKNENIRKSITLNKSISRSISN